MVLSSDFERLTRHARVVSGKNLMHNGHGQRNTRRLEFDCSRMKSVDKMYDVFSHVLEFPAYFGRNIDAFEECVGDCFLDQNFSYSFVFVCSEQFLAEEPASTRHKVAEILAGMLDIWNSPINDGEAWDRPEIGLCIEVD